MKKFLNTLWKKWKKLALTIGKVQTAIVLSLIYYLIITPIGILSQTRRLVTRNPETYWLKRKKDPSKLIDFYKQY